MPQLRPTKHGPTTTADVIYHSWHTTPHLQAGNLCLRGSQSGLSTLQLLMGFYYMLLDSLKAGLGLRAFTLRRI